MSEIPKYNPKDIEKKWQDYWREQGTHATSVSSDKSFYILDMFPYPSGEGLHVGHPKGYIATDIYSRLKRMQGYNVLHPMGFDAFGLPAEQFAIKNKMNPRVATAANVARYKEQLEILGLDYDWDREVNTTDPAFYKWTQWMWKQMYKDGLAYESYDPINWCPSCMTGLANEDLDGNACERCGTAVEQKSLRQWTIRITDYADRLLADVDNLDWEPHIKELQKNWIGKSEGAEIDFEIINLAQEKLLTVFTTRPDTMYGVTYLAISAEKAEAWMASGWAVTTEVADFVKATLAESKNKVTDYKEIIEKKGIDSGIKAINPVNGDEIPVWIANYVLPGYGTGVVMAVPAHDERDFEFATKYNLPIIDVCALRFVSKIGSGIPNVEAQNIYRHNTLAIIKNLETDKYIVLDWNVTDWVSFVGGGVEEGENYIEASIREVKEETGFANVEYKYKVCTYKSYFYNPQKNINYDTVTECVYLEVQGISTISKNEQEKHTVVELDYKDVSEYLKKSGSDYDYSIYCWEKFITNNLCEIQNGYLVNSAEFDGLSSVEAKTKIVEKVGGRMKSQYKLRDWVFARQRYWGEPFPIVFDEKHRSYAVADSELPVMLPDVEHYEPTGTGESPLAAIDEWVNVYGYINSGGEFESIDISQFSFDKTEFMDINLSGGTDQYQPGAPVTERSNIAAIIKHPTEDKYLVSKWKASNWNGWLTGGIEAGDTPEDTVRTEVREESGYTDIASIDVREYSTHCLFYHPVKKQNRLAHYRLAIVELASLDQVAVSEAEQAICDFVWVDKTDVADTLTRDDMKSLWADYIQSGEVYASRIRKFRRETNTMPQWAGSSWYYLRYIDPHNTDSFAEKSKEAKWSPVDFYVGGAEHATRHLIYARFWHKYLFDKGYVSHDEPFKKLQTVGLILAEDGRKMSKRWGNVINPDDVITQYGADTLRLYTMFMGPFDQSAVWSTNNIVGTRRFLERAYKLQEKVAQQIGGAGLSVAAERALHSTIQKVTDDITSFKHNTAVSTLMTLQNIFEKEASIPLSVYLAYMQLLAPFAPHMSEEIWQRFGGVGSVHSSAWPLADSSKLVSDTMTITVQVNGKLRGTIEVGAGSGKDAILTLAKNESNVSKWLTGNTIVKEIYVPKKLVNFVIDNGEK
jgi:leucyl-tRNA synthetase